jgi:hypothetical protein
MREITEERGLRPPPPLFWEALRELLDCATVTFAPYLPNAEGDTGRAGESLTNLKKGSRFHGREGPKQRSHELTKPRRAIRLIANTGSQNWYRPKESTHIQACVHACCWTAECNEPGCKSHKSEHNHGVYFPTSSIQYPDIQSGS